MFQLTIPDILLRVIPDAIFFVWAFYYISKTTYNMKRFVLSCLIQSIGCYLIRSLPITFGINSLLIVLLFISVNIWVNKIPIIKAIKTTVLVYITMFFSEIIEVAILQILLKEELNEVLKNPLLKNLYAFPSFILFVVAIVVINKVLTKRASKKLNVNVWLELMKEYIRLNN